MTSHIAISRSKFAQIVRRSVISERPVTETDQVILAALRANARMSVTELASHAGVSRATARSRLDSLKASGRIRRFTIETDVDADGPVRAISMVQLQGRLSRAVIRTLTRIPEVTTVYSTNGTWDLVIELRTESLVRFDTILRQIREIPGVLNSESCLLLSRVSG